MKILFMIDTFVTCDAGTESQLLRLINGLVERGHSVDLCSFWDSEWRRENPDGFGCDVWIADVQIFRRIGTYSNIIRLIKRVRSVRPDIVHSFFPTANALSPIVARLAGTSTVISSRRDCGLWHTPTFLATTSFANLFVSGIAVNSDAVRKVTESTESFAKGKVSVLRNGIDTNGFDGDLAESGDAFRERWNIPADDKLVGIVANLRPVKRHGAFLKAAKSVLETRGDVTFILVGDGDLRPELEASAAELGIDSKARFLGRVNNAGRISRILDVGVSASVEGFSNAVIEYMLGGAVPIVAAAGGNLELIEDGANGFSFPVDDSGALARRIVEALGDDSLGERFKRESDKRLKELSVENMVTRYEEYYEMLLAKSGAAPKGASAGKL